MDTIALPTSNSCVPGDKVFGFFKSQVLQPNSTSPFPLDSIADFSLKLLLYALAMLSALVGNALLVFTHFCTNGARSVGSSFIASLALYGLLMATICMSIAFGEEMFKKWPFGDGVCKLKHFTQATLGMVGMLMHTGVALNNFLKVYRPFNSFWTSTITANIIVISWLAAMTSASPQFFVHRRVAVVYKDQNEILCRAVWPE
ncbi:substance-K receptor, partial [Biomphalaria glabrata]